MLQALTELRWSIFPNKLSKPFELLSMNLRWSQKHGYQPDLRQKVFWAHGE
jgi:hypothetical protein